jgi:RND family efflux transporter MFP subunit
MNRMRPWWLALAITAAIAAVVAWRLSSGRAVEADAPAATALVTVAPIEAATIEETVTAYGVIGGSPGASRTLAAPRGVIVERLLATPGQPVAAGQPLIVLANTPATQLAFRQAEEAAAFAQRDLERLQRLYDAHLAAGDQLDAARKTLGDAQAAAVAQTQSGAGGGRQTLSAPFAGVVSAVSVTAGEHVAADAPLMTLIASGGMVAQLGVEPARARGVSIGQPVRIASAFDPSQSLQSQVAVVGRQVDPATRLVTVIVPAQGAGLALGGAVQGTIVVARHAGLRASRAAVVYDEDGAHVFVITAGKAHQRAIRPGVEQAETVEIAGAVKAGEMVAVEGAYQLRDGWPVRTAPK